MPRKGEMDSADEKGSAPISEGEGAASREAILSRFAHSEAKQNARVRKRRLALVVFTAVFCVAYWYAPDDNYLPRLRTTEHAVMLGRSAAWAVHIGNPDAARVEWDEGLADDLELLREAGAPTPDEKNRLYADRENLAPDLLYPALVPTPENLQLVSLLRRDSFVVLTFGYEYDDNIVTMPPDTPLLYTICLRYVFPADKSVVRTALRKLVNMWPVRYLSPLKSLGTTQGWIATDFRLTATARDYFNWLAEDGVEVSTQRMQEVERGLDQLQAEGWDSFEQRVNEELAEDYEWAYLAVEKQMRDCLDLHSPTQSVDDVPADESLNNRGE